MTDKRDPLEYVMNRMENAAQSGDPAGNGYGPARQELIEGIRSLRAALARAEKTEGALCRAREHMEYIARHTNKIDSIDDAWMRLLDVEQLNNYVTEVVIPALSSSSPCPHEAEKKRLNDALKEACRWLVESGNGTEYTETAMRAVNAILYPDLRAKEVAE